MGSLYLLTCDGLDYEEELHEGAGMSGAVYTPMLCRACRRIVAVETSPPVEDWVGVASTDAAAQPNRCPHCAGDQLEEWGQFGDGEPRPGLCPRCQGSVELHDIGIWD